MKPQPLKPLEGNWREIHDPGNDGFKYISPLGIIVISSVHIIYGKPEYHISISDNGSRIAASIAPWVLKKFGASDFIEDNHAPRRIIRSFWKKIGEPQKPCICEDEKPEVDGDYI